MGLFTTPDHRRRGHDPARRGTGWVGRAYRGCPLGPYRTCIARGREVDYFRAVLPPLLLV